MATPFPQRRTRRQLPIGGPSPMPGAANYRPSGRGIGQGPTVGQLQQQGLAPLTSPTVFQRQPAAPPAAPPATPAGPIQTNVTPPLYGSGPAIALPKLVNGISNRDMIQPENDLMIYQTDLGNLNNQDGKNWNPEFFSKDIAGSVNKLYQESAGRGYQGLPLGGVPQSDPQSIIPQYQAQQNVRNQYEEAHPQVGRTISSTPPRLAQQDQGVRPGMFPHMNPSIPDAAIAKQSLSGTGVTPPNLAYENAPGSPINQQRTMASMLANGSMLNPQVQSYLDSLAGTPQQRTQGQYNEMLENRVSQLVGPTYAGRQSRLEGLDARLSQPQQRMDGAASLQGRLTATGAQYPTGVDQGPQQRAFQPNAGTFGRSTVTVDPQTGKATMTGGYDEIRPGSRLAQLGVNQAFDQSPTSPMGAMVRDDSQMQARQTANRRRMEAMLDAKRLGQAGQYDPGDPVTPGQADPSVYQARLGDMRQDRNRFSDMLARRRQGRELEQQAPTTENLINLGANQDNQWGNYVAQQQSMYLQTRPDMAPDEARRQAEIDASRRFPNASGAQSATAGASNTGNETVARTAIDGVSDLAVAEDTMADQGFDEATRDRLLAEKMRTMTPAQQQQWRTKIAARRAARAAWAAGAPAREAAAEVVGDTYGGAGFVMQ